MLFERLYFLPLRLPLPALIVLIFALSISSHTWTASMKDLISFVFVIEESSSTAINGKFAWNLCPRFFTSCAFPVAAIADLIAFERSLSLIFSVLSFSGFGGWASLPLTAWGILAALLPFLSLATLETPLPG